MEKELASAKRDIKILWDVCEPQINAKLEQGMQEIVTALAKLFNVNVETAKKEKKEKSANIGKKQEEKQDVANNEIVNTKEKRKINSALRRYYDNMNLNLSVKNFREIERLDEKEAATLLYLFDQYKYLDEIAKHIELSKASLLRYAHILKTAGYLIYKREMGRVANGCLIYNK